MGAPGGGWTPEQLRAAVDQHDLSPARPATITVERLDRSGPDGTGAVLDVAFEKAGDVQRWRLTFDSMWADVSGYTLEAAAPIVRANVVEWWDTRGHEAVPAWLTVRRL